MTMVFAGALSHAPGITGRAERADPGLKDAFRGHLGALRRALLESRPEALVVIAAEHFANFFMNNMPAFAMGMAPYYEGPIEDERWLAIRRTRIPGAPRLSRLLIEGLLGEIDLAYCEEWKFDHGIMVPLHFLTPDFQLPVIPVNINCQGPPLTPLARAWTFGEALRRALDALPERVAVVATGGLSHWPCTPESGKINVAFDREFLERWSRNDRAALLSYTDAQTYREAGQGGFEIRTFISLAAASGGSGHVWFYEPIPIYAVGCTVAVMEVQSRPQGSLNEARAAN